MKVWRARVSGMIFALCFLATGTSFAQGANPQLQTAIDQFFEGQWEQTVEKLTLLLDEGELRIDERSQARKFIGLSYILLGEEERAVPVFKELARDDPSFDMRDLAIEGGEPPPKAVRYFGQAVLEVRQEEIKEREVQLRKTSRKVAFLRSMILPGWGQRYQGYRGRGFGLMGLTTASIAIAVWAELDYRDARDAYDRAPLGADFEKFYTEYQDRADRADLVLGVVGGIWLLNAIDAALQGPNITRPQISLKVPMGGDGLQVVYLKEF